jgi:dienelactone hydrolase
MTRTRSLLAAVALACSLPAIAAEPPRGSITIERIAHIKYPSAPAWSPDGKSVAFLWDSWGKQDLFVAAPGAAPVPLTDFPLDPAIRTSDVDAFVWRSADEILFTKGGTLYSVSPATKAPHPLEGFADAAQFTLSKDKTLIAFLRGGQAWFGALDTGVQRQVTNMALQRVVDPPVIAPEGATLALVVVDGSGGAEEEIAPQMMAFNGTRMAVKGYPDPQRIGHIGATERKLALVSVYGGGITWIPVSGDIGDVQFTADGLLWSELSADGKTRLIRVAKLDGTARTLWRDTDDRWFSPTERDSKVLVSPDGKSVAFVSDRSGWIQLYVMPVNATSEAQAKQLTRGDFVHGLGGWSPDSRKLAYHHGALGSSFESFIDVVDVGAGVNQAIVAGHGVSLDPAFSPDGASLVFSKSDTENSLDIYTVPARAGATATRLSDSMPEGLDKRDLTPPVAVSYPSRLDKKPVPATLMVAKTIDRTKKNPALVWIHGSGRDQNFIGWHPGYYRMYYALCQYLAQQGYVIVTPDYRGSSGYSRDWSSGVYKGMGISDAADVAGAYDYLKSLPYVDADRIGIFGLSYGGHLTLQAMTQDPTQWRAGVDVAGVVDWATYYASYTWPRQGTPVTEPQVYDASAPIRHLDKLSRPLLVLHGTNDVNVSFIDSLRLFDQLIKLGKPFESQIYPGEIHFFRRDFVLRDAWMRIDDFFERTVKK